MDVLFNHCLAPWQRGVNDCYVAVADQIMAWTGVDLMQGCRGFSTYTGMIRLVRHAGYDGPLEAMESRLKDAGWRQVAGPFHDRDVTMVAFFEDGKRTVKPAIHEGGYWVCRGRHGLVVLDHALSGVEQAWRLGDGA